MNKKKIIPILFLSFVGILVWSILWSIWTFFTSANFEWTLNDRKMYRFQSEAFQNTSSEQFRLKGTGLETKINAVLNFRVLSVEKERVKLAFQFSPFEMEIGGKRMPALEELNSVMFLMEWDRDGNIMRMIFPSEVAKKDEALITQNLLLFQSIIIGSRRNWMTKEDDTLGRFTAKYNYKDGKILKSKLRYLKIFDEDGDRNTPDDEDLKSNIQISYSEYDLEKKGSWIRKGTVREQGELSVSQFDIQYRKNAVLEVIPFQPDLKLAIWADGMTFDEAAARLTEKPKKELSIQEEADKKRIALEYKGQDILSVYNKYFSSQEKFTDLSNMEKMREYLANFPDESAKIPDMLLKGQIRGPQVMEIIHLLASVGHREAQSAIVKIFSSPAQSANAKMQALAGVHEIRYPNDETLGALWSVYEDRKTEQNRDYSNTAVLALGSAASNLKKKESSAKIKERITAEIKAADKDKDSSRTAVLINSAGNTGDSSLLPEIKKYVSSEDKIVRTSLYDSLGNFKDKESLNLLQNGIEKETSPEARTKIMQSLLRRPADDETVKKAVSVLPKEQDPNTRNYILQYMIQNRKSISDFKEKMKAALEKESFENNRDLILKAMHSE